MAVVDQIGRNVQLKKIEHSERMSEETNCFVAAIYLDGKKIGDAEDDGHGGCMKIYPQSCVKQLNEIGAAMGKEIVDWSPEPLDIDGEDIIGKLLDEWLLMKDYKKLLRGKKVTFVDGKDIYSLGRKFTDAADEKAMIEALKKRTPTAVVFNGLTDEAGLSLYLATTGQKIGWKLVSEQGQKEGDRMDSPN
ncbi:MAG: hypothetical protein ACTS9Y_01150 [Methylophilus sp.]|uniref:hypothetical protein n=1 Tax=Methylophilus sp. TaxID=29541 RepID=UPI003F9F1786